MVRRRVIGTIILVGLAVCMASFAESQTTLPTWEARLCSGLLCFSIAALLVSRRLVVLGVVISVLGFVASRYQTGVVVGQAESGLGYAIEEIKCWCTSHYPGDGHRYEPVSAVRGRTTSDTWFEVVFISVRNHVPNFLSRFRWSRGSRDPATSTVGDIAIPVGLCLTEHGNWGICGVTSASQEEDRNTNHLCCVDSPLPVRATYSGSFELESRRILFVAGDRQFECSADMNVYDFARKNDGEFLLAVAAVYRDSQYPLGVSQPVCSGGRDGKLYPEIGFDHDGREAYERFYDSRPSRQR